MIGKTLLGLFRGVLAAPTANPVGDALTPADRRALATDLGYADAVQPGLGKALLEFVLTGDGEAVLLQVEHLLQSPQPTGDDLRYALAPYNYRYKATGKEAHNRRIAARHRVLFGMEGFDAAILRRFGLVFALIDAQASQRFRFPGSDASPMWLRRLLDMMQAHRNEDAVSRGRAVGFLTAPRIRAMLDVEQGTVAPLVDCLFVDTGAQRTAALFGGRFVLDGLAGVLAAEPEAVVAVLRPMAAPARAAMAGFLASSELLDAPAFFDFAFTLAADGAKTAREAGLTALGTAPAERVRARAAELLASASADDRLAAVNALAARFGAESLPGLVAHEAGEKSKKVLEAIAAARAMLLAPQAGAATDGPEDGADGYTGMDGVYVPVPPRVAVPDTVPADTAEVFRTLIEAANAAARRDYDNTPTEQRDGKRYPKAFEAPFKPGIAPRIAAVLQGAMPPASAPAEVFAAASGWMSHFMVEARRGYLAGVAAFLDGPDVSIMALTRLRLAEKREGVWANLLNRVLVQAQDHTPVGRAIGKRLDAGADLRDIVNAAEMAGSPTAAALPQALQRLWGRREDGTPPNPTVWPVLAAHFAVLDAAFAPGSTRERSWVSISVTGLLELFPTVPRRYFPYLIDRAATGNPLARNQARALLRGAGDLTPIIATMLGSGDASRRIGGARWMGERRDPAAVPPLRAALKVERTVAAKAALLAALAACGDDISGEFSEDRLLGEAEAGLPKTKADYGDLFDATALPVLHWADGREVPGRVVQWWFARAHKLKQPGGDPLLHMAMDRLDRRDAERLGQAVLAAFIQFDTRKVGNEGANAYAQANAASRAQTHQRWNKDYTEAQAFAELRREKLGEYLGSALPHQGLLALARFAAPADAAAMVRRYLRDHGKRSNQCRALLDALAANPVPAVLQLILATSQRHKQPGTRKYAGELAASLAEERGWTAAELADRTIPSAGLDDDGVLDLPIGARAYRARIAEASGKAAKAGGLVLVLENPDGKAVASLPTPTDPAEAEEASAAKKVLSAAKKELTQTVESQTARLYEAMCAARRWPVADFDAYLVRHPIAGRLLRRLILAGFDAEGQPAGAFRPLDDGTFSDAADGPVALDGFASIGIAHRATLGEAAAAAWAAHLADYEVKPLFEQLNRSLLTPADAKATEIGDRLGWLIDSTTLRTAATALGYQRGSIEDGGCFYGYEKHLPDLGIAAVVGFTGSFVPETERRPGALRTLTFVRLRPGGSIGWGQAGLPLGQVPPVLLSEAWNDLHAIAAQGAGFDAEWEKKALW